MKFDNTSNSCKKTNAVVLAPSGRVGTNFIASTISSDPKQWFYLGEFFNHITWDLYVKISIVNMMCKHKSDAIFKYHKWIETYQFFLHKNLGDLFDKHKFDKDEILQELEKFIETNNEDLYETTIEFMHEEMNKNTLAKIFIQNTSLQNTEKPSNNINLYKVLESCNALIVPFRQTALLTYISETKARMNNIWYITSRTNADRLEESKNFKIIWNKQEYLNSFQYMQNAQDKVTKVYNIFNKPKCIVNFEILHSYSEKDKLKYLQNLYDTNKIDAQINCNNILPTIKQSRDQNLEHHFTNPEEFLKDLPDIPIFLNYE